MKQPTSRVWLVSFCKSLLRNVLADSTAHGTDSANGLLWCRVRQRRTVLVARTGTGRIHMHPDFYYMKGKPTNGPEQEPIGIVISRGSRQEDVPRVFAYVWGPAPETSEEPRETKVA